MSADVLDRKVRLADADTIRSRFASPEWGEPHSGDRLAKTLGRDAGAVKAALGVVMVMELAVADYAISLGSASAVLVLGPLSMRKGQIADIITATPEDAAAVRAALAVAETHAEEGAR